MASEIEIQKAVYREINGMKRIPKEYVDTIKDMVGYKFGGRTKEADDIVDKVINYYFNT